MKLELKHLAPYLPYKVLVGDGRTPFELTEHNFTNVFKYLTTIYLHPLSDLTKEIEVNGEKLVPMVELAKILNLKGEIFDNDDCLSFGWDENYGDDMQGYCIGWNSKGKFFGVGYSEDVFGIDFEKYDNGNDKMLYELPFTYDCFQKLLEWHFDIFGLIENGLAIDINTLNKEL